MFYSQFPMQYHLVQTVENQGKFGLDYYTMKEKESILLKNESLAVPDKHHHNI